MADAVTPPTSPPCSPPPKETELPVRAQPFRTHPPTPPRNRGFSDSSSFFAPSNSFSTMITEKLNDKNFLLWKQQIELVITGHRLNRLLVNPSIPPPFLIEADRDAGNFSEAYVTWEQQDALLLS